MIQHLHFLNNNIWNAGLQAQLLHLQISFYAPFREVKMQIENYLIEKPLRLTKFQRTILDFNGTAIMYITQKNKKRVIATLKKMYIVTNNFH